MFFFLSCVSILRRTIVVRTYGALENYQVCIFAIFTNNIWSYQHWSPAIVQASFCYFRRHFFLFVRACVRVECSEPDFWSSNPLFQSRGKGLMDSRRERDWVYGDCSSQLYVPVLFYCGLWEQFHVRMSCLFFFFFFFSVVLFIVYVCTVSLQASNLT